MLAEQISSTHSVPYELLHGLRGKRKPPQISSQLHQVMAPDCS